MPVSAAILVTFVGFALRVWHLNALSISGDDVNSISFATQPLAGLLAALATYEPHPPFYDVFLHGWLAVAGQWEFASRFPSVVFGTLGVASAYVTGRVVGGRAAAIFAASQYSVLQSQNGRMYTALQAWVALFLAGLILFLQHPNRKSAAVVVVAGTLAAYTHYHGLLAVALGVVPVALATPCRDLLYDETSGRVWPVVDASGHEGSALDLATVSVEATPASALIPEAATAPESG